MRRLIGFTGMAAVTAMVLDLGGPGALLPFKAAAQAVTNVSVAFVVDFSGSEGVQSACVKVPSTDNEYQALALFTAQEHEAAPTYNSSGLLCSIGGVPTSGCGQAVGREYIYWSYWHGDSGNWQYSNTGASGIVHTCNSEGTDCDVEGWKFENPGAGNPTDPPPQVSPDYTAICSAGPVPTTTATGAPSTLSTGPQTTSASPSSPTGASPKPSAVPPTSGSAGSPTAAAGTPPSSAGSDDSAASTAAGSPAVASSGVSAATATPGTLASTDGSLAATGPGPGVRWTGVLGLVLLVLGIGTLVIDDCVRRARRRLVGSAATTGAYRCPTSERTALSERREDL